jgi:WD40 repeat protein
LVRKATRRHVRASRAKKTFELIPIEPPNRTLSRRCGKIRSLAIFADGQRAICGTIGRALTLYDLNSGEILRRFKTQNDIVLGVTVHPDQRRFLSTAGGTIRLWDIETEIELRRFVAHKSTIYSIAISSDGRRIFSAGDDQAIRIWDLENGIELTLPQQA